MNVPCFLSHPEYKPGDPPPADYLAWQEWARVQERSGLRQFRCSKCCKWVYPQECPHRKGKGA